MARVKIYFEPDKELLTVFWQEPRAEQICTEVDDGIIVIKDERTGEPIGRELLSYHPGDARLDVVSVEVGSITVQPARS
jgi:hypothetical protein